MFALEHLLTILQVTQLNVDTVKMNMYKVNIDSSQNNPVTVDIIY